MTATAPKAIRIRDCTHYNLYYSVLRQSRYKWLDLVKLFNEHIQHAQNPNLDLVGVKFFTAPVKAKFAAHGRDSDVEPAMKLVRQDFPD